MLEKTLETIMLLFERHPFEIFTCCCFDDMTDVETMLLFVLLLQIFLCSIINQSRRSSKTEYDASTWECKVNFHRGLCSRMGLPWRNLVNQNSEVSP